MNHNNNNNIYLYDKRCLLSIVRTGLNNTRVVENHFMNLSFNVIFWGSLTYIQVYVSRKRLLTSVNRTSTSTCEVHYFILLWSLLYSKLNSNIVDGSRVPVSSGSLRSEYKFEVNHRRCVR